MRGDPLPVLKSYVRALEEAYRDLALALASEETAGHSAAQAESEINREMETATRLASTDADVEAFGLWLLGAWHSTARARAATASARAETDRCRVVLSATELANPLATRHDAEANAAAAHAEIAASRGDFRRARPP